MRTPNSWVWTCLNSGCLKTTAIPGRVWSGRLERLRDLVCQVPVDVLLVYSPDRLARKYAYQALLIEEFAKAGTTVMLSRARAATAPKRHCWCSFRA